MKDNQCSQACNTAEGYRLYVVYDCASAHPRLLRVQNPLQKLIARAKGSVVINATSVREAAEGE